MNERDVERRADEMLALDGLATAGLAPPSPTSPRPNASNASGQPEFAKALADAGLRQPAPSDEAAANESVPPEAGRLAVLSSADLPIGPPGAPQVELVPRPDRSSEAVAVDEDSDEDETVLGEIMALQSAVTSLVAVVMAAPQATPASVPRAIEATPAPSPGATRTASIPGAAPATAGPVPMLAPQELSRDPGEALDAVSEPEAAGPIGPTDGQPVEVPRAFSIDERSASAASGEGGADADLAPPVEASSYADTSASVAPTATVESSTSGRSDGRASDDRSGADGRLAPDLDVTAVEGKDEQGTRLGLSVAMTDGGPQLHSVPADVTTLDATDLRAVEGRIVDTVVQATQTGDDSIRLVLSPPELGHLDIHVERTDSGLRVEVTAATAEAADIIQQALPGLVSGLEARSLRVDRAEVHVGVAANGSTGNGLPGEAGSDAGRASREFGERGSDGRPQWARPEWSEAARLGGTDTPRGERGRTVEQLLDLVA